MSLIKGHKTSVEEDYNFVDLNSSLANSEEYFESNIYPELEHVYLINESWSISPNELSEFNYLEKGFGYLAKLK